MSIIDYLQRWNLQKKLEKACRVYLLGQPGPSLSVQPPKEYSERFFSFVKDNVLVVDFDYDAV